MIKVPWIFWISLLFYTYQTPPKVWHNCWIFHLACEYVSFLCPRLKYVQSVHRFPRIQLWLCPPLRLSWFGNDSPLRSLLSVYLFTASLPEKYWPNWIEDQVNGRKKTVHSFCFQTPCNVITQSFLSFAFRFQFTIFFSSKTDVDVQRSLDLAVRK